MALLLVDTNLLDVAAQIEVDVLSKVGGEAEEIQAYFAQKVAALQAAKTSPATPLEFVNDGFALATAISEKIGNPKVTAIVNDVQNCEKDAVAGKVLPELADLIHLYKDIQLEVKGGTPVASPTVAVTVTPAA